MYARESRSTPPRRTLFAIFSCLTLSYSAPVLAKPDMQPLGPNIAEKGSAFYHFSVHQFDSADGARHYRVWTAVPNKAAPPTGYPVLYMLDGNAVMDRLSDELLKQLTAQSPPVIVAVGYQTNLPFDLKGRSFDYTPVDNSKGATPTGRKNGGSHDFRQLLETRIAAKAEQGLHINPQRRGLWGHSYGGLFVLDSWLSSSYFHAYYSASPSLSRDNFALLSRITAAEPASYCGKSLVILEGSATPGDKRDSKADQVLTKVNTAMTTLKEKGVDAAVWDFPGLGHGPMFNASFRSALLDISREKAERVPDCH
ncbi:MULTISPECIES: alpha/beta hydrolase [Klebsiella]|uniref:alpha/beta hydrolase n=1 Tax=Klebsiella TaxID=570 RepID=UPI00063C7F1C|nr:alpha/beta hydrolase [Klebsiella aerogenes]EIW9477629.1 alpha/beta hydrolase [Klebsiella aerogenes]EIW9497832.1 alpha/beta hydrolase [Klebsiella aerogenes]EKM7514856.1 alpha/beta hydrolase [Klebsiella aerogenes]ELW9549799.1 alpha/beta hydrolase [Klebsiella aerogenes]KLF24153.1 Salmochelin siderophore protein IroE [Klebsiella aerogenes]